MKNGNGFLIVVILVLSFYTVKNFATVYEKYVVTDTISYKPAINSSHRKFIERKENCTDLVSVFTRRARWTPAAIVKKCPDGRNVDWTVGSFEIVEKISSPQWVVKYEQR